MTFDDLDLPAAVRADVERFAEEFGMSGEILLDHVLEVRARAEDDDRQRAYRTLWP